MKKLIYISILATGFGWSAIPGSTVWEIRTTGSDTNGGGYVPGSGGMDMSQYDNKNASGCTGCYSATVNLSTTDVVTNNNTTITSATCNCDATLAGNIIYLSGAGTVAGWYEVIAVSAPSSPAATMTLDRATGSTGGTGVTMNIGGALASPGQFGAVHVGGNTGWIKAGTYTVSSTASNISGGKLALAAGTGLSAVTALKGYGTSRGDLGTKPILQVAASGVTNIAVIQGGAATLVDNIEVDGQNKTAIIGAGAAWVWRVKVINTTNVGIWANGVIYRSEVSGFSGIGIETNDGAVFASEVHDGTGLGIYAYASTGASVAVINALVYRLTGSTADGVELYGNGIQSATNVTVYGVGRDGFTLIPNGASSVQNCVNCVAYNNGRYGFNGGGNTGYSALINCAGGKNGTANTYGVGSEGFVAITDTSTTGPFVNATTTANGAANFVLNNNAGAGALLRAAGMPGIYPSGGTVGYTDLGAAQHQDSGSGPGSSIRGFTYVQ